MKHLTMRAIVAVVAAGLLLPPGIATSASSASSAPPAVSGSWPMAGYNAAASSRNPNETTLTAATVPNLVRKRGITLPPGDTTDCGFFFEPGPVLVGTTLFTLLGTDVAAFNIVTGERKWRSPAVDPIQPYWYTGLAVLNGRVYVGARDCISRSDPNGALWAFDAATGVPVWSKFQIPSIESMVVSGGKIITAGTNIGEPGSLNAYDPATGEHVWIVQTCTPDPLIVVGQAVMARCPTQGSARPALQAMSLVDGHVLWRKSGSWFQLRGDTDDAGAAALYAMNPAGYLTALTPSTGAAKWISTSRGSLLAVGKNRLIVTCDGNALCALSRGTGARIWKAPTVGPAAPTEVIIAADVIYPSPGSRPLVALTGEPIAMPGGTYPPGNGFAISSGYLLTSGLVSRVIDVYGLPS